jgi:hypothetical protein|eukprot:COSAG01_NODE_7637_length_3117_cov_227.763167_2_plen_101_part_00
MRPGLAALAIRDVRWDRVIEAALHVQDRHRVALDTADPRYDDDNFAARTRHLAASLPANMARVHDSRQAHLAWVAARVLEEAEHGRPRDGRDRAQQRGDR